jgi:hypothetical protein
MKSVNFVCLNCLPKPQTLIRVLEKSTFKSKWGKINPIKYKLSHAVQIVQTNKIREKKS